MDYHFTSHSWVKQTLSQTLTICHRGNLKSHFSETSRPIKSKKCVCGNCYTHTLLLKKGCVKMAYSELLQSCTRKMPKGVECMYNNSTACGLYECYQNPSLRKRSAERYIKSIMADLNGGCFRIISHNHTMFTCGFLCCEPYTGIVKFCYFTRDHISIADYNEEAKHDTIRV